MTFNWNEVNFLWPYFVSANFHGIAYVMKFYFNWIKNECGWGPHHEVSIEFQVQSNRFSFWTKIHFLTGSSDFVSIMTNRFMNNILIFIKILTNVVFAYSDDPYKGCSMSVLQITLEMYFSSHFIYSSLDSIKEGPYCKGQNFG